MTVTADEFTPDELMCVCIARRITDGDVAVQGIGTPLVAAGYLLAKLTHAPDLRLASAIGQGLCQDWAPLGLAQAEQFWLGHSLVNTGFIPAVTELLPRIYPVEFFRPAQVDMAGNFNNLAIGGDYKRPRIRLPGSGGIPDVSVVSDRMHLYVPRHSRVVFVPKVDFVSGLGHTPDRPRGSGPVYLVSNLGQFDWAAGRLRLVSYHPGVTIKRIRAKTGFELVTALDVYETLPPSVDDIRLLRETIDPWGIRRLETLAGAARKDLLRDILAREKVLYGQGRKG